MEVSVLGQLGETVETINLDDAVFNTPMNNSLVHQAMVTYQLNKRHGTHDTKTRAEVSGGGRKPWIQKHTGRARQGSIRAPQWRHGGVVFGPHPRSYRRALPRRMRRAALRCVLSQKARDGRLVCLNSLDTINGKTKSMVELLANLGISGSALLVTQGSDRGVVNAAHNLKKVWTLPVNLLNAQELLARETLIITRDAVRWAEESLISDPHGRAARSSGPPVVFAPPTQETAGEAAGEAAAGSPPDDAPDDEPAADSDDTAAVKTPAAQAETPPEEPAGAPEGPTSEEPESEDQA